MEALPIWLENNFEQLSRQFRENKLPHGILVAGYKGDGSGVFMQHLVRYLLCLSPGKTACGTCKSCMLGLTGHHPDYLHVEPEGKSMTIKVDAIRAATHKISETAQQGGCKVVYIESAQKMNTNAANALLKVLEEPTANTYILLETDQIGQTLPTVRSRCRLVQLAKPSVAESIHYLQSHQVSENMDMLLGIAMGRPLDALSIESAEIQSWHETENRFLQCNGFTELSQYISKVDINSLYNQILIWVDTTIRIQQNLKIELAPVSEGLLQSMNGQPAMSLFRFRDYIIEKMSAVKRQSNLNVQLMSEELASRWIEMRGSV